MSDRFEQAIARFDAANAEDPHHEIVDGDEVPKELIYGKRMSEALADFAPEASEALRLAVRAQHLQRWKIPRSDYPMGRVGYLRWRKELKDLHAELAGAILKDVGYDDDTVERVGVLLRKKGLKTDPEVQLLEDVVCLVFLRFYLDAFAADHEDSKVVDILRKTWGKMSEAGRAAALRLDLGVSARLVEQALA
ncbi:MAG: DUF4202 domain-containing protein [Myxococcota bacterium]